MSKVEIVCEVLERVYGFVDFDERPELKELVRKDTELVNSADAADQMSGWAAKIIFAVNNAKDDIATEEDYMILGERLTYCFTRMLKAMEEASPTAYMRVLNEYNETVEKYRRAEDPEF